MEGERDLMIGTSCLTAKANPCTSWPWSLPLWGPYGLPSIVSTCRSFPQNYTIKSFRDMELKCVIPSAFLEFCLHSRLFNCGYTGFDRKRKLMCSEMDVTDNVPLQEIQQLSLCVSLPPNGIAFFIKRFLFYRDRFGFFCICSICRFLARPPVLSTNDTVNTQKWHQLLLPLLSRWQSHCRCMRSSSSIIMCERIWAVTWSRL